VLTPGGGGELSADDSALLSDGLSLAPGTPRSDSAALSDSESAAPGKRQADSAALLDARAARVRGARPDHVGLADDFVLVLSQAGESVYVIEGWYGIRADN
jgi:hypothetical protein